MKDEKAYWKVHLPNLIREVMSNEGTWVLREPFNITFKILTQMAERAVKDNNEIMIAYCARLGLYEASEPGKEGFEELKAIMDKYFK
jgi:hypothetical protein